MSDHLRDYNEVKDRVEGFNEEYPDGRIITSIVPTGFSEHIVVRAKVFKNKGTDARADATGLSWLKVPGSTNFTRGSELENAETSAVGRALAFIGFYAKGESLASKQEIAAKKVTNPKAKRSTKKAASTEHEERVEQAEAEVVGNGGLTTSQRKLLFGKLKAAGLNKKRKAAVFLMTSKNSVKDMDGADLDRVIDIIERPDEYAEVWENIDLVEADVATDD